MKFIYHCYGGAHSSVVAAALHLGLLEPDVVPTPRELMSIKLFDKTDKTQHGCFHRLGTDDEGNEVFSVGFRNHSKTIVRLLRAFSAIYGIPRGELVFVDTLDCVNWRMRLGGWLSRSLKKVDWGRPLVLSGTQLAYSKLAAKVASTKERARRGPVAGGASRAGSASCCGGQPGEFGFPHGEPGPKVLYRCYAGAHTSVVCAAYRLRQLPEDRRPTIADILALPLFDGARQDSFGQVSYMGRDAGGTSVFVSGFGPSRELVVRALRSYFDRVWYGHFPGDLYLVDCLRLAGPGVRVGGFLARKLGLRTLGRQLAAREIVLKWRAYRDLARVDAPGTRIT